MFYFAVYSSPAVAPPPGVWDVQSTTWDRNRRPSPTRNPPVNEASTSHARSTTRPPHGPGMPLPIHPHVHTPNDTRPTQPVPHPHHLPVTRRTSSPFPPMSVVQGSTCKGRPVRSEATPFRVLPMFFPWRIEHRSINQCDFIASVSFSASP